jgi:Dimerisation domain
MATPPTPEGIMQLGFGYWGSKTLLSAVELGLFTALATGPQDAEALTQRLGLHPRGARDFFDALVALGMVQRDGTRYRNTPETDLYLDRAKPSYIGGILEMSNARYYGFWGALTAALRTGRPQSKIAGAEDAFTALYSDPERLRSFLAAMTGRSMDTTIAIAQQFPWRNYQTFVDIGTA